MEHAKDEDEHAAPLLNQEGRESDDIELTELNRPERIYHPRRASHSSAYVPTQPAGNKTTSYIAIAAALLLTVLGFTVNTEATAYFEDVLGWKKPFCTLYVTHSSLCLPWLGHLAYLRFKDRKVPYGQWVRDYNNQLRESVATIDAYATSGPRFMIKRKGQTGGPLEFLAAAMGIVTLVLTVSGVSWFLSLALTTPADLTAIYNCATFFAAVFSVPLLKEKLGWISIIAVALSIIGTFIIAYGDTTGDHSESQVGTSRLLGNLVACIGAVAFGLYEVLFKKWACSSKPMKPEASLPLTLAASAFTGVYTFLLLWVALVILHFTGVEPFVLPSPKVALWLVVAVLSGSMSINLLAILVIWTDPVFGSMANVLSVFFVALADWIVFGLSPSIATYIGGVLITVAFVMLTKDTLGEKKH